MNDADLNWFLKNLGLTPAEAVVFASLHSLGKSELGRIVRRSGLHRGTAYNMIQRLIEKGCVGKLIEDKKTYYFVSNTAFLSEVADQKQNLEKIESIAKEFQKQMELNQSVQFSELKNSIVNYSGIRAYKDLLLSSVLESGKKDWNVLNITFSDIAVQLGLPFHHLHQNLKVELDCHAKAIMDVDYKSNDDFMQKVKHCKFRWLPDGFPNKTSLKIWGDKVLLTDWSASSVNSVLMNGKATADFYRALFNSCWENQALNGAEIQQ